MLLAGFQVLEIADMVAGPYCGKLLASLGAEVIKAETPLVGDPARRRGPFPGDVPHLERSGLFLYLNTGKKGITLNLEDRQGQLILNQLAGVVDVVSRQVTRDKVTRFDPFSGGVPAWWPEDWPRRWWHDL